MTVTFQPESTTRSLALAGTPLASFSRRALALGIDFLFAGALFLTVFVGGASIALRLGWIDPAEDINLKFTFFRNWYSVVWLALYFAVVTYFGRGQTFGKRLCRIRVVSVTHERLGFWHSAERALGYGASTLEFGFGFLQYFLRKDRRTVHDRIAETIVVSEPPKPKPMRVDRPRSGNQTRPLDSTQTDRDKGANNG